jgi:RND family efflux transporter MFP subunit
MAPKFLTCFAVLFLTFFIWNCDSSESNAAGAAEEQIPVEIKTIELGQVVQSLSYNGDIEAEFEVKVFSKVPDRIETFNVDEGDRVRKGRPIARITSTTIEQAVRQAEAGLVAARAQEANMRLEYERAQRLYQGNALSKQQYDAIETQYEAAKAQTQQAEAMLNTARSQLDDALVTAPISGIIGKRYYEAGDMATPSLPLVSIVQMDRVKICFDVTEVDLGRLKTGQDAVVQVRSYPDQPSRGRVSKISPVLDPLTRMAEVEVLIDNPGHLLKPGMFARVEVMTGVINDVIVVPRFAVIENTTLEKIGGEDRVIKNYYVFVVDSSRAEQRRLEVLYMNHQYLAVSSGIRVGEKLVTLGQNFLRDSVQVMIVNEE